MTIAIMDDLRTQSDNSYLSHGVTDVYVTIVHKDKVPAYREWLKQMHHLQAEFPGFQKVYVQVPKDQQENNWVTLLKFDTEKHLEKWLQSPQRKTMLNASKDFITSQQNHRLYSSFGSWFSDNDSPNIAPLWKQSMLVLLVLFPAVMLETIYLFPYMTTFNPVLARFMGAIIVVCSLSWILMPTAIYSLNWWLNARSKRKDLLGALLVLTLYLIEIVIFFMLD